MKMSVNTKTFEFLKTYMAFQAILKPRLTQKEIMELIRSFEASFETMSAGQRRAVENLYEIDLSTEWRFMTEEIPIDASASAIIEPVKIEILRSAFDSVGADKKLLLRQIKTKAIRVEFGDPQQQSPYYRAISPEKVIWFFEPSVFLSVIKQYPWILRSDLGGTE